MNDPIEVLISGEASDAMLAEWQAVSPRLSFRQARAATAADYRRLDTRRAEILLANGPYPDDITIFPRLRWIQQHGAGIDWTRNHPIRQTPIVLTTAAGLYATPIAEYVMAGILAWKVGLSYYVEGQRQGQPRRTQGKTPPPVLQRDLHGQTLGIIGYGSIGRAVARMATGFGLTILACNRSGQPTPNHRWSEPGVGDPAGQLPAAWYGPDQLRALLPQCDFVVISAPLTDATAALIGRAELALLKPTAYLVNIARGGIVDQDALAEAIAAGRLGGATLDAATPDPLPPGHPLWAMDPLKLFITPHISGRSHDYARRVAALFKENLRRYVAGEPLLNRADWAAGY